MEPKPWWKSPGKLAGILVLVFIAATAVYVLWRRHDAYKILGGLDARIDSLIAEERSRSRPRPILVGEPVSGNAWDDYRAALEAVDLSDADRATLSDYREAAAGVKRESVVKIVERNLPVLEKLTLGARKDSADYGYDLKVGSSMDMPGLLDGTSLTMLVGSRARLLREDQKPKEAAELLLHGARFSSDLAEGGPLLSLMISLAGISTMLDEFQLLVESGLLSKEDLTMVTEKLGVLEETFPDYTATLRIETIWMLSTFLEEHRKSKDSFFYSLLAAGMWADSIVQYEEFLTLTAEAHEKSWPDVVAADAEILRRVEDEGTIIVRITMPGFMNSAAVVRGNLARLRILIAACRTKLDGRVPDVKDPFGEMLRFEKTGSTLKIWSRGKDGTDDGGSGDWKLSPGPDIVWTGKP